MINLNNETDYKLLDSTNKFYIFFIYYLSSFFVIFFKLSLITFEKINKPKITDFIKLNPLPTILDSKEKILAYSDYNYSIVKK